MDSPKRKGPVQSCVDHRLAFDHKINFEMMANQLIFTFLSRPTFFGGT